MLNWVGCIAVLCVHAAGCCTLPLLSADWEFYLIDRDSGQPVSGALLRLTQANGHREWELEADDGGRVRFAGIKAGQYRLQVEKTGYVDPIDLEGNGRGVGVIEGAVSQIVIGLERSVVIAGQVSTESGRPLSGMGVFAARVLSSDGGVRMQRIGSLAFSDDRGHYRLHHIPSGSYAIVASPMGDVASGSGLGLVYYPGHRDVARAEILELAPGAELHSADIRVQSGEQGAITGTVTGIPPDWAGGRAAVALVPRSGLRIPVATGTTDSSGQYRLEGVPAGDYQVLAWGPLSRLNQDEPPQGMSARFGSGAVSVRGGETPAGDLALAPGVSVEVRWPPAKSCLGAESLRMRMESGWPEWWVFEGHRDRDGVIWGDVPAGTYRFEIPDLERSCTFAGVQAAKDRSPAKSISIQSPVVLTAVTVASNSEISGTVQANGVPAPRAIVVLSLERDRTLCVETRADGAGQFRVDRLPPGAYRITALPTPGPSVAPATSFARPVHRRIMLESRAKLAVELDFGQGNLRR